MKFKIFFSSQRLHKCRLTYKQNVQFKLKKIKEMRINFFGNMEFGNDPRVNFFEKWGKMTIEEKIKFLDAKVVMMENFGDNHFFAHRGGRGHFKELCEEWSKMTAEEKENFIKQKEEDFRSGDFMNMDFCERKDMSVENIDTFCEEWVKKTNEEKAEFIREKSEERREMTMHMFSGGRGFGFNV